MWKKIYILICTLLALVIVFLYLDNMKSKNLLNSILYHSFHEYRNDLYIIDSMETPTKEAIDKEHLYVVVVVLDRAIIHSETLGNIITSDSTRLALLPMREDIRYLYNKLVSGEEINDSDYKQYLSTRERISALYNLINNNKFNLFKLSNKKILEEYIDEIRNFQ